MYELLLNFFVYGFLGWCTEVAFAAAKERKFVNRGFLNGPICPIYGIGVTVVVTVLMPYKDQIIPLYLWSVLLVTVLEGLTGYLLEKLFHHRWWDYTGMPLNIGGHVCLLFSVIWGVTCVAIVHFVHPMIAKILSFLPVWLGGLLLAAFCFALAADLYVTVTGILKFNRRLARMEEIAQELHRISDQLGENIYRNTMEGIEIQDRVKAKAGQMTTEARERTERATEEVRERTERTAEEVRKRTEHAAEEMRKRTERTAEELRQRAEQHTESLRRKRTELRARYQELAESLSPAGRRLLDAFPNMKPRRYEKHFAQLKEHLKKRREHEKEQKQK